MDATAYANAKSTWRGTARKYVSHGDKSLDFSPKSAYHHLLYEASLAKKGQKLSLTTVLTSEEIMAHKKIERKKELARRRHRRLERLKIRRREAQKAGNS
jgi:hypothetical protein